MNIDRTWFGFKRPVATPAQLGSVKALYNIIERMKAAEADARAFRIDAVNLANAIEEDLARNRNDLNAAMVKLAPSQDVQSNDVAAEFDHLIEAQPA